MPDNTQGEALKGKLSGKGGRLTPQRLMVLEAVQDCDHHVSAEEICKCIHPRYPHLNISTVYRTLELLKDLGLVTENNLGDGILRYHSMAKGHHHHLVCRACGVSTDIGEEVLSSLAEELRQDYGFEADLRHLAVFGLCRFCQGKTQP